MLLISVVGKGDDFTATSNILLSCDIIGEASASFEHCFEFLGTWRIKNARIAKNYISDSNNWAKGIKITDVKSA